jgi:hypothetical protein
MANLLEEIGQNLRIAGGVSSPQVAEENSRRRQQFEQVKEQRAQLILQMGARAVESGAMTPEKFQLLTQKYGGGDLQLAGPSVATQKTQADMVAEQAKTQKANQLRAAYEQELSKYENPPPVTTPEGATVVEGKRTLIDDYMRRSELATRFGQDDEAKRWRELANTEINAQKLTQEKTGRNVQFVELPTGKMVNGKAEIQSYAVVGRNEDGTPKLVPQGKPAPKGSLVDVNVGGMTPEQAAKTQLVDTAISDLTTFRGMILPGGKVDRAMVLGLNTPGFAGAPGTDARTAYSLIYNAIEAKLRAQSGAAVPEIEVEREVARFVPSPLDNDATIKSKLDRLEGFLKGTYVRIKKAGPSTEDKKAKNGEPEVRSLSIETEVQGVPIYSDAEKEKRYQQWKKSQDMK